MVELGLACRGSALASDEFISHLVLMMIFPTTEAYHGFLTWAMLGLALGLKAASLQSSPS